jgi:hypothetical protein
MAIKRYGATKTNTITNAFKADLSTRGTGSNMGEADVMEVFSLYGEANAGTSRELSRVLVDFPVLTTISSDRTAGKIPASGSVNFILKLTDAPHTETTPRNFTLNVAAVSSSWVQGTGVDTVNYTDIGASNWINSTSTSTWTNQGGDFLTGSGNYVGSQLFVEGTENLAVDVTSIVENQIKGTIGAYGFGVFLTSSLESALTSYYTKKFFASGSEYYFYRPILEARWNSSLQDDSNNFYLSSSLANASDNINTLYLYNVVRGQLKNIPAVGTGRILLTVHTASGAPAIQSAVTGGWVSTGIYSASIVYTGSATEIYPVWYSGSVQYHTGSAITVNTVDSLNNYDTTDYYSKITNLKASYATNENPTLRLYVRPRNWNPNIFTVANSDPENTIIKNVYYKIFRVVDNYEVIAYGTGTSQETLMSYDKDGNYFNLDMSMFESGYMYGIKLLFKINDSEYQEQPQIFKFRVA